MTIEIQGLPAEKRDASQAQALDEGFKSPFDFSAGRKWLMTVALASLSVTVTFGSSVFSSTIVVTSKEFNVSETVMILGVSLYVAGFAVGPILWGPLSEFMGRRYPVLGSYLAFALLQIPVALSHNLTGILVARFLAGCFGACAVTITSASYADFWEPAERGTATAVYSAAIYIGPTLGPIIGTIITESNLGWRWTAWVTLIMAGVTGPVTLLCVPETYGPVLRERAIKRRQSSAVQSAPNLESRSAPTPQKSFIRTYLVKPGLMMIYEPMLIVMTLYISIVYGILYLSFYAFPFAFKKRGWEPRIATLPFLSILVGVLISSFFVGLYSQGYYQRRLRARGYVVPEDRLPPMMVGSILLPVGLFWFAWTSSRLISWVPQVLAGAFVGAGIMLVFTNGISFIVDVYLQSAASALAANTCVRSLVAAGFPLAAPQMYKTLGTSWATTVLGCLCVLVIPAPFLFYVYGKRLRQMSKFAPSPPG